MVIQNVTESNHRKSLLTPLTALGILLFVIFGNVQPGNAACRYEETESCEAICRAGNCTVTALVILPSDNFYEASLSKVMPILKIAEDDIRRKQLLPANVRFSWIPQDDQCDASYALIRAMDGITRNCSHVIFGPVCDFPLASVGRISKYFHHEGTPVISVGGASFDFKKKKTECQDEFYMLIRTGVISFQSIAELNVAVMKRYNWDKVVLLTERNAQMNVAGLHSCYLMMQSLVQEIRSENLIYSSSLIDPGVTNYTETLITEVGNRHSRLQLDHAWYPAYQNCQIQML